MEKSVFCLQWVLILTEKTGPTMKIVLYILVILLDIIMTITGAMSSTAKNNVDNLSAGAALNTVSPPYLP